MAAPSDSARSVAIAAISLAIHMAIDHRAGEMSPAELGEALAGDDAELGGQRLEQHGHGVGQHYDPQQHIAELRAALDVGGEVAGVHVGDRGDHRWPGEGQERAQAAPLAGHGLASRGNRAIGQGDAHAAVTIL